MELYFVSKYEYSKQLTTTYTMKLQELSTPKMLKMSIIQSAGLLGTVQLHASQTQRTTKPTWMDLIACM